MKKLVALVGNPNSGKTTLFNALTNGREYVGNWPGVTVEKKVGRIKKVKGVKVIDLPGVYSLSPYSPEETVTRNFLTEERPDVIINIVDSTNLERNLYLTTQLLEFGIPVIVALNMTDVMRKKGDKIHVQQLSEELGCPVVEVSALKNTGVDDLLAIVKQDCLYRNPLWSFAAPAAEDEEQQEIANRYDYIEALVTRCVTHGVKQKKTISDTIDTIVTNKYLAFPIFALIMFGVYYISVSTVGALFTDWTNDVLFGEIVPNAVSGYLSVVGTAGWINSLILDGIIGGVGAVLGFVPQLAVLFLLLSLLEDCGYMSRVAFIMDKALRRFGLSGKSFIPMLIGTGCSVPGIMASRTIENEAQRKMTIITTSFIPCGAKLPIIALIAGALFRDAWWVAPVAYFIGIAAVLISGIILQKYLKGQDTPFVMELPDYHMPTPINVLRTVWDRCWGFIKKAGTIIFVSCVILWFLSNFNFYFQMVETGDSILAYIGQIFAPIFAPLGFGSWEATVATVTGLIAKENVVGSLGVLLGFSEGAEATGMLGAFTALSAFSFLVFNLLCAPCFAAVGAIRREMASGKWTWIAIGYQTALAYGVALMVYQFGSLLTGGGFSTGTVVGLVVLGLFLYAIFGKPLSRKKEILCQPSSQHS